MFPNHAISTAIFVNVSNYKLLMCITACWWNNKWYERRLVILLTIKNKHPNQQISLINMIYFILRYEFFSFNFLLYDKYFWKYAICEFCLKLANAVYNWLILLLKFKNLKKSYVWCLLRLLWRSTLLIVTHFSYSTVEYFIIPVNDFFAAIKPVIECKN